MQPFCPTAPVAEEEAENEAEGDHHLSWLICRGAVLTWRCNDDLEV